MIRIFAAALALACASSLWAAPAVTVAQGGNTATDYTALPQPSATDALNGKAGVQIDSRTAFGGGPVQPGTYTDGALDVGDYNVTQGSDYPGLSTPQCKIMWDIRSGTTAVNLVNVRVFSFNGGADCRCFVDADLYVTTDAVPAAGSTWTKLISKGRTNHAPLNLDYGALNTGTGAVQSMGILMADDAGGNLANGVTGLRLDFYAGGWDKEFRDPDSASNTPVQSMFVAEVDADFGVNAGVSDWSIY